MLQDPESPDKDIAPLVSSWTKQLVSKIDKLEQSVAERNGIIESLEKGNDGLESKLSDANSKNKSLLIRLTRLEPTSGVLQSEMASLKALVEQLSADKNSERQKVQNLNMQLSTLLRQSKAEKRGLEKREQEKSMSRQPETMGDLESKDLVLKKKYDALEMVAREVVRDCGMMAGDNFGPIGLALAKLKKHMDMSIYQ